MQSQHHRFAIWNQNQHPYKHKVSEFAFTSPALPGVTNVESAINYILAVLYPQTKAAVANVAALPASGNTLNDFRVVNDDGDGNAAGYRWEQREGEVSASWHKIYDMDWGVDSILTQFHNQAQDLYFFKYGNDDLDVSGAAITGTYAGQHVFGGRSASTNLTLSANAGDGTGAQTGYVQTTDHFRPTANNTIDLGTAANKFRSLYIGTTGNFGTLAIGAGSITDSSGAISFDNENLTTTGTIASGVITVSTTLVLASGSITSTTGAISFNDENLSTTGTLASGTHTVATTLVLASGSITSTTGAISFNDENLSTTGTLGAGAITGTSLTVDNLSLDLNTLNATTGNLNLTSSAGSVAVGSAMTTVGVITTGTMSITGQLNADNLRLDGNVLSSTDTDGNITLTPNGTGQVVFSSIVKPAVDASTTLGASSFRFLNAFISNGIGDGTNLIAVTNVLLRLRHSYFREATEVTPASNGDILTFDSTSGTWLAAPFGSIAHTSLTGLTTGDAGHTQFVMLAGRSGGQTVQGGTAGGEHLLLESTSNASKGLIKFKDALVPNTNASYSGGWSGTNIGGTSNYVNNIYMKGEIFGARPENLATGSLPGASAQTPGRLLFDTTTTEIKYDSGAAIKALVDLSLSQTLTNKTISGASNTITNVSLTTSVTGTLPIANGGTGQTTKAPAFDALSPMDAAGQLIYGGTSGTGTKLAAGTSGQYLKATGASAPAWTSFIPPTYQPLTSGTLATYTLPAGCLYIKIKMVGGGGGGSGSGTAVNAAAGDGGSTLWLTAADATLLTAGGGVKGVITTTGGAGGTATIAVGSGIGRTGQAGVAGNFASVGTSAFTGGAGGSTPLGAGGAGGYYGTAGNSAANNTGGGGQGGGINQVVNGYSGSGGGAGAYIEVIITSPSSTYHYTIGTAGNAGTGTGGNSGGAGGTGFILVEEHYQ